MINTVSNYKLTCYKRNGDLDHEEYYDTFPEAKEGREEWCKLPDYNQFERSPTIWQRSGNEYRKLIY